MAKASSSELIDKLGKAPPKVKAMVFAGAAVFLGVVYYFMSYSSMVDEEKSLKMAGAQLAKTNLDLNAQLKTYNLLVKQKKDTEKLIEDNKESFPASSELPSFFRHLQSQAIAANVRLVKWTRETESPVNSYVRVPVSVEVTGSFYELERYFKLLKETKRIITVENLFIGGLKREGEKDVLTARFRASTFRQSDAPAPTAAPGQPAPPPPAKK